jgi:hypothetical protein
LPVLEAAEKIGKDCGYPMLHLRWRLNRDSFHGFLPTLVIGSYCALESLA